MPKRAHSQLLPYMLSFLLPALVLLVVYARLGVFPFGEKSLLLVDMDNEYIDYYAHLNRVLHEGGSLVRSWNMGMGLNSLGLIAFYTASPFTLIAMLAPVRYITEAVLVMTLLKVGLCGVLFYHYARHTFPGARPFLSVFSVAYALCAYNIAYSSNLMWLDGAALLPLVLLGAERVLRGKGMRLFVFALAYVFVTGYYIGYMAGIFCFLYFTAIFFAGGGNWRRYLARLRPFLLGALLAAGCGAFLLLPAFLGLHSGQAAMWGSLSLSFSLQLPLTEVFSKLLPGVYDSLTDAGLPNLYCSVLGVFLAALYFLNSGIRRREKAVFGALAAFLLLSFSCEFLNLGWHAFEDPTWFPARYSFVFSFLTLHLGLRCLNARAALSPPRIAAATLLPALLFAEIALQRYPFVRLASVLAGLCLLAAYAALLVYGTGARGKAARLVPLCVLALVLWETGWNADRMVQGMDKQFAYKSRQDYLAYRDAYAPALEAISALDSGVYRVETLAPRNANGGMALGYRGISHYSSTTDQALNTFLCALGNNRGTINELRFAQATPLTGGLLGVRYILSVQDPGAGYRLLEQVGKLGVYENLLAFPLAFWAPGTAEAFSGEDGGDPFALQNGWLRALSADKTAPDAFLPLAVDRESMQNFTRSEENGHIRYNRRARGEAATLTFTAENAAGQEAYAFVPVFNRKFSGAKAYAGSRYVQRELSYRYNSIIPLGNEKNTALTLETSADTVRIRNVYLYTLDMRRALRAAGEATRHAMRFIAFTDTAVEGAVTAPGNGILATTFPYDTGWHVWVDGKRVVPVKTCGVFLAIPLTEGEHHISMRYAPPGLGAGMALTALCAGGILLYEIRRKFKKRRKF